MNASLLLGAVAGAHQSATCQALGGFKKPLAGGDLVQAGPAQSCAVSTGLGPTPGDFVVVSSARLFLHRGQLLSLVH